MGFEPTAICLGSTLDVLLGTEGVVFVPGRFEGGLNVAFTVVAAKYQLIGGGYDLIADRSVCDRPFFRQAAIGVVLVSAPEHVAVARARSDTQSPIRHRDDSDQRAFMNAGIDDLFKRIEIECGPRVQSKNSVSLRARFGVIDEDLWILVVDRVLHLLEAR